MAISIAKSTHFESLHFVRAAKIVGNTMSKHVF